MAKEARVIAAIARSAPLPYDVPFPGGIIEWVFF
jgi:hypothetical protein